MESSQIVFIVNSITFYKSHRLDLVNDLKKRGLKVEVWCGNIGSKTDMSLADEIFAVKRRIPSLEGIKRLKFLVANKRQAHYVIVSPLLIIVFRIFFSYLPNVYYNFSGLGEFRKLPNLLLKLVFALASINFKNRNRNFVFQNESDFKLFAESRLAKSTNVLLIEGSGFKKGKLSVPVGHREKLVFGYVGRISKKKGIITLLQSFNNPIVKEHLDLVIWGRLDKEGYHGFNKNELNMIERKANVFLGFSEDKEEIYRSFDVFCIASDGEGISKSAIEACAFGKPLLMSDVPGARDMISQNGKLFIFNSSEDLVKKLKWFHENRGSYMLMSKASEEIFERKFSHERILNKWYNILSE